MSGEEMNLASAARWGREAQFYLRRLEEGCCPRAAIVMAGMAARLSARYAFLAKPELGR